MRNIDRDNAKTSVGKGWSHLIDEIYDILPPSAEVAQVKEKFGGLRFYVHGINDEVFKFIQDLELQSFKICEVCGLPGELRKGKWIKTLCEKHFLDLEAVNND